MALILHCLHITLQHLQRNIATKSGGQNFRNNASTHTTNTNNRTGLVTGQGSSARGGRIMAYEEGVIMAYLMVGVISVLLGASLWQYLRPLVK